MNFWNFNEARFFSNYKNPPVAALMEIDLRLTAPRIDSGHLGRSLAATNTLNDEASNIARHTRNSVSQNWESSVRTGTEAVEPLWSQAVMRCGPGLITNLSTCRLKATSAVDLLKVTSPSLRDLQYIHFIYISSANAFFLL